MKFFLLSIFFLFSSSIFAQSYVYRSYVKNLLVSDTSAQLRIEPQFLEQGTLYTLIGTSHDFNFLLRNESSNSINAALSLEGPLQTTLLPGLTTVA